MKVIIPNATIKVANNFKSLQKLESQNNFQLDAGISLFHLALETELTKLFLLR